MKPMTRRETVGIVPAGATALLGAFCVMMASGCYVPLQSYGIPAWQLTDEYRTPERSMARQMNYADLTVPPPPDYIIGPNDTLELTIPGLYERAESRPIRVQVMANGKVTLPLIGSVPVAGMNLSEVQQKIDEAYSDGFLVNPRVSASLAEKGAIDVVVLGQVRSPGVHALPRFQNDIVHALAAAGGLDERAAEMIEVHRRVPIARLSGGRLPPTPSAGDDPDKAQVPPQPADKLTKLDENLNKLHEPPFDDGAMRKIVLRIPLRGLFVTVVTENGVVVQDEVSREDVMLQPGDVVVVPQQQDEVFFVVGPLSRSNVVNFSVRERDRQLGNAFLLPNDRDIDVVTAVAMAGYIDPIESPSTVTVHRMVPGESPMTIRVDLMTARYDWNENLYVQPGDIIYLNPDSAWYFRRTLDRIVPALLTVPYARAMRGWIFGGLGN